MVRKLSKEIMRLREHDLLRMIAALLSGAAIRICDSLLPSMVQIFKVAPGHAALTVTLFAVTYSLMQLVYGPLGDRFGKPQLVRLALFGASAGAAVSALAPSFDILLAGRFFWGCAGAGVVPLCMAWIGDEIPYAERQGALAQFLIGTLSGMALGTLLGGALVDTVLGWRGAFLVMALAYLFTAMRLTVVLKRPEHVAVSVAAGAGRSREGRRQAVATSARMIFAVFQLTWPRVVLLTTFLEGVFLLGPLALVPSWLHARFGLSPATAALCASLYAVGGLVYALVARTIVARIGEQKMIASGTILIGLSLAGIGELPAAIWSVPATFALGFGAYLFHNTLQVHATQMAPNVRGTAVSLFTLSLYLGQAVGVMIAGWLIDRIGQGYLGVFFTGAAAIVLVGACFLFLLVRRGSQHAVA
ncbi:MFS transporter [Caballeronia sp. J97]|uniref:MFS transporter n=1 Tax=Caballeronia sp. J97 TaxID=2805429 RepID=UPI002AAF9F40|nr:MFS transporter [Caballeronia sp. J97]